MKIIGLTGKARAGKDTAGGFIEDLAGQDGLAVLREGFADRLKLSAARIFHPDIELAEAVDWCNSIKHTGELTITDDARHTAVTISGRQFLQRYGTDAHRDVFGPDFWLDAVLPPERNDCDLLVVTDVRFPNEAKRVREHGGVVWRIERPNYDEEFIEAHVSEAGIPEDLVDLTLVNDGSLDALNGMVNAALNGVT